jgi:hypothetical protein
MCFLCLVLFGSGNVASASFPINNIKKEDGCRTNTRYSCKNMKSMVIIACKLKKSSELECLLKLKSMLNVSSKQNLKANSAAVKQYPDSLSPDEKAQV